MSRNEEMLRRILIQFEQVSRFTTSDPMEAAHVALLKDCGFVEAEIKMDAEGHPTSAQIGRLTADGYDKLESVHAEVNNQPKADNWDYERKNAERLKDESQNQYDKMISYLSSGAIALAFSFVGISGIGKVQGAVWKWMFFGALLAWAISLSGLLFSFHTAQKAFQKYIEAIDKGNGQNGWDNDSTKLTRRLNISNGAFFFIGLLLFASFVFVLLNGSTK